MRVLICPQSFAGSLTAVQAAEAMAAGWRERAPHDELTLAPLSDGGPGFASVVQAALGGVVVGATVSDPLGRDVPASVLVVDEGRARTAYVEAAQAAGLHLLSADDRDPLVTSTYGVGQLVQVALEEGATKVVLALGGTATNDAGAGLLAALGAGERGPLSSGGGPLAHLGDDALAALHEVRARLRGVELVAASEESMPLLGFEGCSAVTAAAKGASPAATQRLESALGRFTEVVGKAVSPETDLLTGLPRRLDREPGAGAGGGLGYALYLLGARRASAVGEALAAWDVAGLLERHDLVLTGEGCFDWRSLRESVVASVADLANARGLPTVVLAGRVEVGRRETMSVGVAGAYAVAEKPDQIASAMADPIGTLSARARRLAQTWSPG